MNHQLLNQIFMALDDDHNSTVYEVFLQTLRSQDTAHSRHRNSLITRIPDILDILSEQSNGELEVCASRVATTTYRSEIQSLIQLSSGFHFRGSTALAQLERASILRTSFSSTSLWTSSSLSGIVSFKGFDRGISMGKSSRHWQEDNTRNGRLSKLFGGNTWRPVKNSCHNQTDRSGAQRQSPTPPGAIELKIGHHGCSI